MNTQLPFINKDINQIRQELFTYIENNQAEYAKKGWLPRVLNLNKGIIRGLIELFSFGQWQLYALLDSLIKQAMPLSSTDNYLDVHCTQVGITRRKASKAKGYVFFEKAANNSHILVPIGLIVRTTPNYKGEIFRYITVEEKVVSSHGTLILVEAEEYGSGANVVSGEICSLVTPIEGILKVYNENNWLIQEGTDEEEDIALRERYRLAWLGLNGCTKYAYMAWALSVQGVKSVSILDQHPRGQGTVDIVIRGSNNIPTANLLSKVSQVIAQKAPINDNWLVIPPLPCPVSLVVEIEYLNSEENLIKDEVHNVLTDIFKESSTHERKLEIGSDLTLSLIHALCMNVKNVKKANILQPLTDIYVSPKAIALLESLEIICKKGEEI